MVQSEQATEVEQQAIESTRCFAQAMVDGPAGYDADPLTEADLRERMPNWDDLSQVHRDAILEGVAFQAEVRDREHGARRPAGGSGGRRGRSGGTG